MANNRFNQQIKTINENPSGIPGKQPIQGEPQKSELPIRVAPWPGLPGKSGPDRSNGVPAEKIYAQAKGIAGGADEDDKGGSALSDF